MGVISIYMKLKDILLGALTTTALVIGIGAFNPLSFGQTQEMQLAEKIATQVKFGGTGKYVDMGRMGIVMVAAKEIIETGKNYPQNIAKKYFGNDISEILKINFEGKAFKEIEGHFIENFNKAYSESPISEKTIWNLQDREAYEQIVSLSAHKAIKQSGYTYNATARFKNTNLDDIKAKQIEGGVSVFDCTDFSTVQISLYSIIQEVLVKNGTFKENATEQNYKGGGVRYFLTGAMVGNVSNAKDFGFHAFTTAHLPRGKYVISDYNFSALQQNNFKNDLINGTNSNYNNTGFKYIFSDAFYKNGAIIPVRENAKEIKNWMQGSLPNNTPCTYVVLDNKKLVALVEPKTFSSKTV